MDPLQQQCHCASIDLGPHCSVLQPPSVESYLEVRGCHLIPEELQFVPGDQLTCRCILHGFESVHGEIAFMVPIWTPQATPTSPKYMSLVL